MLKLRDDLYKGSEVLDRPLGKLNQVSLCTLDPVSVKLSRCCRPNPARRGLIGLLSDRGISLHLKNCRELGRHGYNVRDAVEVRWDYARTRIPKPQHLFFPRISRREFLGCLVMRQKGPCMWESISQQGQWEKKGTGPGRWSFAWTLLHGLRKVLRLSGRENSDSLEVLSWQQVAWGAGSKIPEPGNFRYNQGVPLTRNNGVRKTRGGLVTIFWATRLQGGLWPRKGTRLLGGLKVSSSSPWTGQRGSV